ncbi:zinc finger CCCH domain-containing protein 27 isoform X1 [Nymphaea colorata]|uniref:zinc finger CCCH domain-containing protein 27 isoform X1 n=1 Tax=Nymphaea colorata TaxID=210225 RepID=UPI00129DFCC9|nr:zinc finger CCCH domain-containing protein 27 isoform X1 [Nymphaea colorata]XP_031475895.1 zinc finger CCCH domain-containing protein 27 isoform X1 [Nymphaea colorata]
MVGDMKIEEGSLTRYLVANLGPLTEADPVILAKYVEALLKKDKPTKELQKLCLENLSEFLGHETNSFIAKLFQDLENGSISTAAESREIQERVEPSPAPISIDTTEIKGSPPKEERFLSTAHYNDLEKNDITDDEDDDRNHKHRRRETRSQSLDRDTQDQLMHRPGRKRSKPFENGQMFMDAEPHSAFQNDLANSDRDTSLKFEKRRPGLTPFPRPSFDSGPRTRTASSLRNDINSRFDTSVSFGRPAVGKGRGRGTGIWNVHDSRFNSVESLDFSSSLAPHGPTASSIFPGRGLTNTASTPNASWSAFGMLQGMPNGGLDPLHPLHSGLQGALPRPLNPSISIGLPRARCRDFEERGFCLRGDMCPMEHGVNRIVVEDVQSLSQFNLPVSIPSGQLLGIQSGTGPGPSASLPPTPLLSSNRGPEAKTGKYGLGDEGFSLNGALSSAVTDNEADLYDPDKPLWNNERLEASSGLARLSSPKIDDAEPAWDAHSSDSHSFRFSEGNESNRTSRNVGISGLAQTTSSVWGRIGSGSKIEVAAKLGNDPASSSYPVTGKKENEVEKLINVQDVSNQGKSTVRELESKNSLATRRMRMNFVPGNGKASEKAYSTLFVNCIPQKNNKREILLSHFQKFGDVIDIYIPPNSEKAFVQFSRREDAEAALKAPDAVMGNRFIKLWWANRDNIPHDAEGSINNMSTGFHVGVPAAVMSQADKGKENLQSSSKAVTHPAPETLASKEAAADSLKAVPLQKKLELEILKEELRKKQEMLEQKRNDFRRQLVKLEKQGINVKGETSGKAIQQQKAVTVSATDATSHFKVSAPSSATHMEVKVLEKSSSGDNVASPSLKAYPGIQAPPNSFRQSSCLPSPMGVSSVVNRFKLDNRPTSFRVLPPLPVNLANASVLKEHFAAFGDLTAVEIDDVDGQSDTVDENPVKEYSARIIFSTRRSAERAFLNGKCLQGHNLQFVWIPSSSVSRGHTSGENSESSLKKESAEEILPEGLKSCSSSPPSTAKASQGAAALCPTPVIAETVNEEGTKDAAESTVKQQMESNSDRLSDEKRATGDVDNMSIDSKVENSDHDPQS